MITTELTMNNGTSVAYLRSKTGLLDYTRIVVKVGNEVLLLETKMMENRAKLPIGSIEIFQNPNLDF